MKGETSLDLHRFSSATSARIIGRHRLPKLPAIRLTLRIDLFKMVLARAARELKMSESSF